MKQIFLRTILFASLAVALILVANRSPVQGQAIQAGLGKIDPDLIEATAGGLEAEFIIVLKEQADLSEAAKASDKIERGTYVYETLTELAAKTQAPLRAMLDQKGAPYRPYWIRNMIWARGPLELVQSIAGDESVFYVYANEWQPVQLPAPPDVSQAPGQGLAWNIEIVRAPLVWANGANGQGAVIGGQDTGYHWNHPALKNSYRGWNGSSADHNYNWHDAIHADNPNTSPGNPCGFNSTAPCDDGFHGTHTMGTMVGDNGQGLQIGMAPGAEWIGCRNMEQGWGSPQTYTECFEWFVAPYPVGGDPFTDGDPAKAPHVINNSWSCPVVEGCTAADALQQVVESVRAAGIVTVQSAGNSGSGCSTVTTPAAIYEASFTVGATNEQNGIAGFSSRGPVTVDGSGRLKPDIVAPGVGIESSVPPNDYAFLNGTSMAAPHVAGLVALLISADPTLAGRVSTLEEIMTQTALPLTSAQGCGNVGPASVPNNVYGWGRIDALAAFESLGTPIINHKSYVPVAVP